MTEAIPATAPLKPGDGILTGKDEGGSDWGAPPIPGTNKWSEIYKKLDSKDQYIGDPQNVRIDQ
jgi:hypothetical protein